MVSERASRLHFSSIVVDTHSDSISRAVDDGEDLGQETGRGHMDLPRMRAGNVTAQFFACYVSPKMIPKKQCIQRVLDMADAVKQLCARYPDQIELARSAKDVRRIAGDGKLSAILCIEGGHAIEDDLAVLRQFHELGIRYMTLTWNNTNNWADGVLDEPRHDGLNELGRDVVREMNRLGMMVDISHVAVKTFWDVMEATSKPVIASHSSAWELCQHPRNMNDDQLRALPQNGGVVCVNFETSFISEPYRLARAELDGRMDQEIKESAQGLGDEPEAAEVAEEEIRARYKDIRVSEIKLPSYTLIGDHLDHLIRLAGIDHVGLGSDFDGCVTPEGMEDCSRMPWITEELVRRGYSDGDIKKVLGDNVLRVMEDVIGE